MVVDGVKGLHHKHLAVHTNIYDYHSHGVKAQMFLKLLT